MKSLAGHPRRTAGVRLSVLKNIQSALKMWQIDVCGRIKLCFVLFYWEKANHIIWPTCLKQKGTQKRRRCRRGGRGQNILWMLEVWQLEAYAFKIWSCLYHITTLHFVRTVNPVQIHVRRSPKRPKMTRIAGFAPFTDTQNAPVD